jgi:predicted ArsR family transcriptional regulator
MTTRQHILDILNSRGAATIEQIGNELRVRTGRAVSAVTIRYHLNVLLDSGLLTEPQSVPRASRGRPQHVFAAVQGSRDRGNTAEVLAHVLAALRTQPDVADMVLSRAASSMGESALLPTGASLDDRMAAAIEYLNSRGYEASAEAVDGGFILYTRNCPYHDVPDRQTILCGLDMRLIENVVGQPIQRLTRLADGDESCAYFIANIEERR